MPTLGCLLAHLNIVEMEFLGVFSFIVSIIALTVSYWQYKLHRRQLRTELLTKYNVRYSIDKDISRVVKYLEQEEGLQLHEKIEKPDDHEVEMFMRFFEELELLIVSKAIDEKIVSYMFYHYLQTFEKYKDQWKNVGYEDEEWKVFHEFMERMKKIREDKTKYKID